MRGLSLLELSLALVVLGLVTLVAVQMVRQQIQVREATVQREQTLALRQALLAFAYAHHRLPCAAADANGVENCAVGANFGWLPWRTLALPEAGRGAVGVRYAVHSSPALVAGPWADTNLATAMARARPLQVIGFPPSVSEVLTPAANGLDLCMALDTLRRNPVAAHSLTTGAAGAEQVAAVVAVLPGALDADSDGNRHDGLNAGASAARPRFEAVSRPRSANYDDQTFALTPGELFDALGCAPNLAASLHAHANAAIAAALLRQATADYKEQLDLKALMASASVAQATGSMLGAGAALAGAVATSANAVAFTILSYGAASAVLAAAAASIAFNTAAVALSVAPLVSAIALKVVADQNVGAYAPKVPAAAALYQDIDANARFADQSGF